MTDGVSCFHSREVAEGTVIQFDRDMRREEEEKMEIDRGEDGGGRI